MIQDFDVLDIFEYWRSNIFQEEVIWMGKISICLFCIAQHIILYKYPKYEIDHTTIKYHNPETKDVLTQIKRMIMYSRGIII